jgi:hypothetical protein
MGSGRRGSNVKAPETAGNGPLWEKPLSPGERREHAFSLYNRFFENCFEETDGNAHEIFFPRLTGGIHSSEYDFEFCPGEEKLH